MSEEEAKMVAAPEWEGNAAYTAGPYIEVRNSVIGPVERDRVGKLPTWAQRLINQLVHRIYNHRLAAKGLSPIAIYDAKRDGEVLLYYPETPSGRSTLPPMYKVGMPSGGLRKPTAFMPLPTP
jgi:hypothetical protein